MTTQATEPHVVPAVEPVLKLRFFSHATIESKDLERARKFYTEFLGLEVVRTGPISLQLRLGGQTTITVVEQRKSADVMAMLNHNGLDVETQEEVDAAYATVVAEAEKWGIHRISKPLLQHGTYSFFFWDIDDNCWEILTNPPGGYSWLFEKGDQEGKGVLDKNFKRPGVRM
jgi:catechol 2,3-dioxygenase-like lactoylglutathione lyase family enzyme